MVFLVPIVHAFQQGILLVHHQAGSFGHQVQFTVGKEGGHLNDAIPIGVESGHFHVYPRVSISKILSRGGELTIDVPVGVLWRKHHWQIGISRYGEKWAALDSEKKVESAFYLSEWRIEGRWQVPESKYKGTLELGAGISLNSRVHYLDLVRGRQEKDLESAIFIVLGIKF